jgi:hypothetical protein
MIAADSCPVKECGKASPHRVGAVAGFPTVPNRRGWETGHSRPRYERMLERYNRWIDFFFWPDAVLVRHCS